MENGDGTKDLADFSPRNQKIANKSDGAGSTGTQARHQSSAAKPLRPNTMTQAAPYTRSHAANTGSQAPNTRKQASSTRHQVSNTKSPAPNTKGQVSGAMYQKNLKIPSTRAGASSPRSGSRQNRPRNAVAPTPQQTERAPAGQQPDRKRILTETNERLVKKEEGYPVKDEKRRRVTEDQNRQAKHRPAQSRNRSGQHGQSGQPTGSYQRSGQRAGVGNRSGQVDGSQDTELGAFGVTISRVAFQ